MHEKKLLNSTIATVVIYGIWSFIQLKSFILPLPFFEIGLTLISFSLAFMNWKKDRILNVLLIVFGLTLFFSVPNNWTFFLSDEQLFQFTNELIIDFLKIGSIFFLILLFFQQRKSIGIPTRAIHYMIALSLLIFGMWPTTHLIIIPLLMIIVLQSREKINFTHGNSLWIHLFVLTIAREISLYLL